MASDTPNSVVSGKYVRQIQVAASGPQGAQGIAGPAGLAGTPGGLSASYKFLNTYSESDPGVGYLAFSTPSIYTSSNIFISSTDMLTDSQNGLLDTANQSTNSKKAVLTIQDASNTRKFSRYYILGSVDNTVWRNLSIEYIDGTARSWTYNNQFNVLIAPIGDMGPQGVPGPGVPAGGLNGQILKKVGTTDYETQWVDASVDESAISNLVDVELNNLSDQEILVYDTSLQRWVNQPASTLEVSLSNASGTIIGGTASTF